MKIWRESEKKDIESNIHIHIHHSHVNTQSKRLQLKTKTKTKPKNGNYYGACNDALCAVSLEFILGTKMQHESD